MLVIFLNAGKEEVKAKTEITEFCGVLFQIIPYICIMIQRLAKEKLKKLAQSFKSVAVIGPRQSGKTTLVKATFPKKTYISLENPDSYLWLLRSPKHPFHRLSHHLSKR